jgi:hypothetical protein
MDDAVTVFVDDAVLGRLPPICVKTGVPTEDRIIQRIEVGGGGLGAAWLLLFFGPIGFAVIVVLAFTSRTGEEVRVQLPMSEWAYQRLRAARRADRWATVGLAVAVIAALLAITVPWNGAPASGLLLACLVAGGVCAAVAGKVTAYQRLKSASVELGLDGSRRWVSMWRVHPTFVAAVNSRYDHPARRGA